jgi:hypothetical protein
MGLSLLSLIYSSAIVYLFYLSLIKCEIHHISSFSFTDLKVERNSSLNEEFPEHINFEFQSMNYTFVFWLRRRGGLIGDISRVITHHGERGKSEDSKIRGRPYLGLRMLVLEGYPTNKGGSKVLEDVENPIARFFAYKS